MDKLQEERLLAQQQMTEALNTQKKLQNGHVMCPQGGATLSVSIPAYQIVHTNLLDM